MLVRKTLKPRISKKSVSQDLMWVEIGEVNNPLHVAVVYLAPVWKEQEVNQNRKTLEELQADLEM